MATKKATTKKDLEDKIAELEAKLSKLSSQLESKPAPQTQAPPAPKPAPQPAPQTQAPPPKPQPAATSPRGSLPAGMKPAAQAPQKTETAGVPATINQALENAYNNSRMTSFQEYRTKVTGYSPAPNRYFLRQYAIVGKVPTRPWNEQKEKVTGYTQPSNQYFATRKRIAYHPASKMFGSFGMTVEGVAAQAQTQQAPPPPPPAPKPTRGTLPAGFKPAETQTAQTQTKSRKEMLEEYEKDYLTRLGHERDESARIAAEQAAQQAKASSPRGSLPKGF